MRDTELDARIAALWIVHGFECVKLLQAHNRADHATSLEGALGALTEILTAELGRERLTRAIDWASNAVWDQADAPATTESRQ